MSGARLKHYGWGRKNEGMTAEEQGFVLGRYHAKFARDAFETRAVPRLEDLALRKPRVALPTSLAAFCTSERRDRVAHTYCKSYPDYVRDMLGNYDSSPDMVAYPEEYCGAPQLGCLVRLSRLRSSCQPFGFDPGSPSKAHQRVQLQPRYIEIRCGRFFQLS